MRRGITALFLTLVVLAPPAAASSSSGSVSDPDDVSTPLDLRTVAHDDDPATITFTIDTFEPWLDREALFLWVIDTDGNVDTMEFNVVAGWDDGLQSLIGGVTDAANTLVGEGSVARRDSQSLSISFERSAIGNPTSYRYGVVSINDANGNGTTEDAEIDGAPDAAPNLEHTLDESITFDPVTRLSGGDRVATAIEISHDAFGADEADAVVLTKAADFPDALAGTPLARAKDGPLLLTPGDALDPRVREELERVLPAGGTVYLLGGTAALEPTVELAVDALGFEVVRLAGADRYETAVRIASEGLGDPDLLVLTTGASFADALSGGAGAAVAEGAVLLTAGPALPASVATYLNDHPTAERVAVGGPAAAAMPGVETVVGVDRYDTSRLVAARFAPDATVVGSASGIAFPDALSGGAHIAGRGGPLVLTNPFSLPLSVRDHVAGHATGISRAYLYGGPAAVTNGARAGLLEAINE